MSVSSDNVLELWLPTNYGNNCLFTHFFVFLPVFLDSGRLEIAPLAPILHTARAPPAVPSTHDLVREGCVDTN